MDPLDFILSKGPVRSPLEVALAVSRAIPVRELRLFAPGNRVQIFRKLRKIERRPQALELSLKHLLGLTTILLELNKSLKTFPDGSKFVEDEPVDRSGSDRVRIYRLGVRKFRSHTVTPLSGSTMRGSPRATTAASASRRSFSAAARIWESR
jgi:hypothetical protein